MAKIMKQITLLSALLTALFVVFYSITESDTLLTLAITLGTTFYHFAMRLLTGSVVNLFLKNRVDYRRSWFRVGAAEQRLYKKLRVRKWKDKMPTYDPGAFDPNLHSWDEIAQTMCQAELVHEVIMVLSFLPIFAAVPFGALPVFVITSLLAACFDAMFVIMQRYNRPRILKLMDRSARTQ